MLRVSVSLPKIRAPKQSTFKTAVWTLRFQGLFRQLAWNKKREPFLSIHMHSVWPKKFQLIPLYWVTSLLASFEGSRRELAPPFSSPTALPRSRAPVARDANTASFLHSLYLRLSTNYLVPLTFVFYNTCCNTHVRKILLLLCNLPVRSCVPHPRTTGSHVKTPWPTGMLSDLHREHH